MEFRVSEIRFLGYCPLYEIHCNPHHNIIGWVEEQFSVRIILDYGTILDDEALKVDGLH